MTRALAWLLLLLFAAACTSGAPASTAIPLTPTAPAGTPPGTLASPAASAPPLTHVPGTYDKVTGTVTGPCLLRGDSPATWLPDPACTPGGADPAITEANLDATLCVPKTLATRHGPVTLYVLSQHWIDGRPPTSQTTPFKQHVVAPAYGLPATADGELDHLVGRQNGGSNDASNLWIEPGTFPNPKDAVENRLHDWMCAGATRAQRWGRLQSAQERMAADWITAEAVLGVPARIPARAS